jgi:hypothetical protein
MPALVVAGIEMLGAALLGAGAGAIGAAVMFYAAEIATVAILAGGLAYSQSQKSKAERAARAAFNAAQVDRLVNVSSSIASRELVMGRVRKGGAIFFKGSVGANNSKFVMCIALAAHEIDAVETIYLNDVPVTLDGSGYVQEEPYRIARLESAQESFAGSSIVLAHVPEAASVVVTRQTNTGSTEPGAQYDSEIIAHTLAGSTVTIADSLGGIVSYQYTAATSKVKIRSYLGTSTQTADATLISLFPTLWTSAHRARGVAYLICEFDYDETAFPSGLPNVSAIIRGAKLYDPRTATTVWSENPALMVRHVLTHPQFGKRTSMTAAEDARITAAANACDASTVYTVDGVAQTARALYTAAIVLPFGGPARDALDDLAQAMGGQWAYSGGEFHLRAGGYTASVLTLTDADLAVVQRDQDGSENQSPVNITTHRARDQMFNVVTATIWDAAQDYKQTTLTPLKGAALITRDGVELVQDVQMPAVGYAPQALHISGIMLRDARDPMAVALPFKLSAYRVELFDTISLTLERYGWTAKTFIVLGREWSGDGSILLTLKETTAAIFTMDADFDPQGYAENTALPSPWDIAPPTITSIASRPSVLSDGSLVSDVLVTWTALTSAAERAGRVEVQWLVPGFEIQTVSVSGDMTQAVLPGVPEGAVIIIRARVVTSVAVSGWCAQQSYTVPQAGAVPANYDVFTVTLGSDNTRIFTFKYTTTPTPSDLAGAVIRFKKGAVGTELWAAMSPLHDGVLTNSPIETTAGDPDVYRFAIKARTRSGLESSDASVRYVDIVLPAIGADQIVALLTTPIFSVPSSSAGVVTTFTTLTGTFRVYYNGVLTTAGLTWSVQSDPSSLGVTIDSGTGVYSLAFPGSPSGWWTAATPSATVRLRAALTADPAAYREIDLVIQKSMAGADAQAIKMNTTAGSMSYDTAGTAYPAAQTITLTLTRIPTSLAGTATWVATAYDSTLTSLGTVTLGGSGDTRTLTSAQFTAPGGSFNNAVQYVNVVATVGTLTANQGIVRLTDGQEAIISFLTNPAVTLPATSAGVVTDWSTATGTFQVWQGNTNVTSGITYAIQSNPSTLWATIHATTGVYSVSGQTSWADASGSTSITFRATHTASGAYRDAVFTLAKAVTGAAGANGSNGTNGTNGTNGADAVVYEIEPSVQTVAKNNIGVMSPTSVTYSFYSKTGSAARAAYSGRVIIETSTDYGTGWSIIYTSAANETSKVFTVPSGITHMRARLHLAGGTTTQVAQITVPIVPDGIRSPMSLNSNSSATAVYGSVTSGAVVWTDAKGNEVVYRKLGYTSAPSGTPADYLVRTDLVTLFDASPPTAGVKPATRYWTGSAWADPGTVIDGNLLVKGTVTMDSLQSGSTILTSGVSFGLGISWGPGSSPSGGYFHSVYSGSFALVCDNVAGGVAIAAASTVTDDSAAAAVFGGGWSGYSTSGGVTTGGYYTTQSFLNTGNNAGIFRKLTSSGTVITSEAVLGNANYAGQLTYGNYQAKIGTASEAVRAAYSTTQVVSLGTSTHAIDITAGDFKYGAITIDAPPNSYSYLDGTGTWRDLTLDGTSSVTSNFTGLRPAGSGANNIWIKFYVGATAMYLPAWYAT